MTQDQSETGQIWGDFLPFSLCPGSKFVYDVIIVNGYQVLIFERPLE